MCGIVGSIVKAHNGFTKATEDVFYQMLYANALRGDDSTGVIFVENNSSFGIMKEAYASGYVLEELKSSTMGKKTWTKGKALIGHNRKATVGVVADTTAHPFVVDDTFAMVHNGTLRNHKALADTVVDSEALAIHLSKVLVENFVVEDFEEAIGKVQGAYALAAYSQEADKVFLTRNSERPLAYIDTNEGFFFASEIAMLFWICDRNGIKMGDNAPVWLKADELLTYDLSKNTFTLLNYLPKKATPVTPTTAVIGNMRKIGQGGQATYTDKSVSKSAFKQMRNHWTGKKLEFYADDYIERDFPNTVAEGSHEVNLMGECDSFTCSHMVYGEFDLYDLPPGDTNLIDCLYSGLVSEMSYNKATGSVSFILTAIKKVPTPLLSLTYENKSTVH